MKTINKNSGKRNAKILAAIFTAVVVCCASLTVYAAAGTQSPDLSKKGSISLQLYSEENKAPVKGGTLALYQVANLYLENGNMKYENTSAFSSFNTVLNAEDSKLASELAGYVSSSGTAGIYAKIASDGSVAFTELPLGIYLIVQSEQSVGYYAIEPFLVTVPMAGENSWIYDVDASPKTEAEVKPETPEAKGESSQTPAKSEMSEDKNQAAESAAAGALSGAGSSGGASGSSHTSISPSGSSGSSGQSTSKPSVLPQTGQLYWPIPVLFTAGAVLIAVGLVLRSRRKTMNTKEE